MTDLASADESVATRFTRVMNATTSPAGILTDPPIVALASSVLIVAFLAALRLDAGGIVPVLGAVAAVPVVVAVSASVALLGARKRVVAWLAGLPFPVENMNAVLNGLGEALEVTFRGDRPDVKALNAALEAVHPDAFVTRNEPGEDFIEIRIGVVESKRNPASSNHRRYARVVEIVEKALVPVASDHPIEVARVK